MLDEGEARELRLFLAHRVSELYRPGGPAASLAEASMTAKGEWLLGKLSAAPNSIGARVLYEMVADFYGVRLEYETRPVEEPPVPGARVKRGKKEVI